MTEREIIKDIIKVDLIRRKLSVTVRSTHDTKVNAQNCTFQLHSHFCYPCCYYDPSISMQ